MRKALSVSAILDRIYDGEFLAVVYPDSKGGGVAAVNVAYWEGQQNVSPRLRELIGAHTAAYQAHEAALDKREDMETFYPKHAKPRMLLINKGRWMEVNPRFCEPWWSVRDNLHEDISVTYDRFRSSVPQELSDTVRTEAITDLNRQQRAAYRRLVKLLDEIAEEQERLGFLAVENEVRGTMSTEIEAMRELLSYPCRNMAECRVRAEHITSRSGYLDSAKMGEGMFDAFLDSFLPPTDS